MPAQWKRVGMALLCHVPSLSHSVGSPSFLHLPNCLHLGQFASARQQPELGTDTVQNVSGNNVMNWGPTELDIHCLPVGGLLTAGSCSSLSVSLMSEQPTSMNSTLSSWGLVCAAWSTDQVNWGA